MVKVKQIQAFTYFITKSMTENSMELKSKKIKIYAILFLIKCRKIENGWKHNKS